LVTLLAAASCNDLLGNERFRTGTEPTDASVACGAGTHACAGQCIADDSIMGCGAACAVCPSAAGAKPKCDESHCKLACEPGLNNCDDKTENGCEVTLANDVENCGRCGHSCLGGECRNGKCQPHAMAVEQECCGRLVLSDFHVYWMSGCSGFGQDKLWRRAKRAGNVERIVSDHWPKGRFVFAKNKLVFNSGSTMYSMAPEGGAATSFASGFWLTPFTFDGDTAFVWLQPAEAGPWELRSYHLFLPVPKKLTDIDPAENAVMANQVIYWTSEIPTNEDTPETKLYATSLASNPIVSRTLAAVRAPRYIAVDDTHVYWAESNWRQTGGGGSTYLPASIMRVAIGGGLPERVAQRESQFNGLALDSDYVYWIDRELHTPTRRHTIRRAPLRGGEPEVVAEDGATTLAVDREAIYWTAGLNPSSVVRLAQ
jgi:hypothetical protein